MAPFKEIKLEEQIRQVAAEFVQRESNGASLITVTRVQMTNRLTKAVILFSVLPEDKQEEVLGFVQRKRKEFKEYVKKHARIGRIPLFEFAIDFGEKNRQRIDEISTTLEADT